MRSFAALVLSSCIALSLCSSPNSSSNFTDVAQGNETCQEYLTYEECVRQAAALSGQCRRSNSSRPTADKICAEFERKLKKICVAYSAKASCLECFDRMENVVESCKHFATLVNCELNTTVKECEETKNALSKYCSSKQCQVCKDLYCRNGGKCAGASSGWCNCPPGYGGAFCQRNKCAKTPCKNGGTCIGENTCKCPPRYSGPDCSVIKSKLGTKENPATNAQAILDAGDSQGSGMYWIQSPGEAAPAKTYCDMSFAGGAWMLASYGYVNASGFNANNKGIPNMNNPFGYNWSPTNRSSTNGLITLPHGAVKMANNARYMIMAAGNNPTSGGIDKYAYVYRISLKNKPYNITFANHNRLYGGQPGRMHVSNFIVEALKGESGTFSRYTLGESLGVTWSDTFPTGYGFYERNAHHSSFAKGPFFPSVHSGSGRGHAGCTATNYVPDVPVGCPNYTHRGWYTANSYGKTGQTSIWFKQWGIFPEVQT